MLSEGGSLGPRVVLSRAHVCLRRLRLIELPLTSAARLLHVSGRTNILFCTFSIGTKQRAQSD